MPRIVLDEPQLLALRAGKVLKITLADGRPIEIALNPPDPPQAREFLSKPRRNNRK